MRLDQVEIGRSYQAVACDAPIKTRNKLETLGLVPGAEVTVIQKTGAGVILEVKHSRLAIARNLAKGFEVKALSAEAQDATDGNSAPAPDDNSELVQDDPTPSSTDNAERG